MSSLPRLQEDFRTAILGGDSRAIAASVVGNTLAGARRVAIHRHHFVITLTEALGATYPVVRHPPHLACLSMAPTWPLSWTACPHSPTFPMCPMWRGWNG